jgi:hypothetical protein
MSTKDQSEIITCPRCGETEAITHRNTTSGGKRLYACLSETCRAVRSNGRGFVILPNGDTYPRSKQPASKPPQNDIPKYWADRLEQEYKKLPPKMPDKLKKSNCFYAIAVAYEAETGEKSPCNKTLARWWKKYC